jgi:hypothetical protein
MKEDDQTARLKVLEALELTDQLLPSRMAIQPSLYGVDALLTIASAASPAIHFGFASSVLLRPP